MPSKIDTKVIIFAAIIILILFISIVLLNQPKPIAPPKYKNIVTSVNKSLGDSPEIFFRAKGYSDTLSVYAYRPDGSFIGLYKLSSYPWELHIPIEEYGNYVIRVEDDSQNILYNDNVKFSGNPRITIKESNGIQFAMSGDAYYLTGIVVLWNDGNIVVAPSSISVNVNNTMINGSVQGARFFWPSDLESYTITSYDRISIGKGDYLVTIRIYDAFGNQIAIERTNIEI